MDSLKVRYLTDAVAMCEAAYLLPTPPTGAGADVAAWSHDLSATDPIGVPEVEVTILAGATVELADGVSLFAEEVHEHYVEESASVTATNGTEIINYTAHGFYTGDGPIRFTAATIPTGLSASAEYWVIRADADTFQVAETRALALAGTEKTFSSDGATVVVHWVTGIKSETFALDSVDATANTFTKTAHGLADNQKIQLATSAADLPASLTIDTDYWVILVDADTFQLAATSNGAAIDIGDAGTGTHTVIHNELAATSETVFVRVCELNEGYAIVLAADVAYRERVPHRPNVVAYHLAATGDVLAPITAYVRGVSVE